MNRYNCRKCGTRHTYPGTVVGFKHLKHARRNDEGLVVWEAIDGAKPKDGAS